MSKIKIKKWVCVRKWGPKWKIGVYKKWNWGWMGSGVIQMGWYFGKMTPRGSGSFLNRIFGLPRPKNIKNPLTPIGWCRDLWYTFSLLRRCSLEWSADATDRLHRQLLGVWPSCKTTVCHTSWHASPKARPPRKHKGHPHTTCDQPQRAYCRHLYCMKNY